MSDLATVCYDAELDPELESVQATQRIANFIQTNQYDEIQIINPTTGNLSNTTKANPATLEDYADISRKLTRQINRNSTNLDGRTSAPPITPNPQQHRHHHPKHDISPTPRPPAFTRPKFHHQPTQQFTSPRPAESPILEQTCQPTTCPLFVPK